MYAIIKSGSRQYQVQPESIISVNRLRLEQGADFETDQVLLVDGEGGDTQIGAPFVSGALVKGQVIEHYRGSKVLIFKHKRRKDYRRTRGHRQELTRVRIDAIEVGGKIVAGGKAPVKRAKPAPAKAPQDAEAQKAAAASETAPKTAAKPAAKPAAKAPARRKPAASKAGTGKKPAAKSSAAKKPAAKAASKPKAAAKPAAKRTSKPAAKAAAKPKAPKGTGKK